MQAPRWPIEKSDFLNSLVDSAHSSAIHVHVGRTVGRKYGCDGMIRMREMVQIHVHMLTEQRTIVLSNYRIQNAQILVHTQHVGETRGLHLVDEKVGACSKSDDISQLRGGACEEKRGGDNLHFNWSRCGCWWT